MAANPATTSPRGSGSRPREAPSGPVCSPSRKNGGSTKSNPVPAATGTTPQPLVEPSIRPYSRPSMVTPSRPEARPSTTVARLASSSRGRTLAAMTSPTTPRTMLIRKIGRQDRPNRSALMRKPAKTGPPTLESARTGPNNPNALANMSRSNALVMTATPCGMSSAPNAPCATRAAMIVEVVMGTSFSASTGRPPWTTSPPLRTSPPRSDTAFGTFRERQPLNRRPPGADRFGGMNAGWHIESGRVSAARLPRTAESAGEPRTRSGVPRSD
ncbi:hypothetical protein CLV40_12548 [Actinokineospora auranticolor]|uniref:Uncharacterized protein n=1 Tax=Actinokineospora auranticolor TaxID=155976 RepID=A0A2S6GES7_9PSEU|nr:hypothetical protein CLV40_12548 [Actinokineospora auranticolor]